MKARNKTVVIGLMLMMALIMRFLVFPNISEIPGDCIIGILIDMFIIPYAVLFLIYILITKFIAKFITKSEPKIKPWIAGGILGGIWGIMNMYFAMGLLWADIGCFAEIRSNPFIVYTLFFPATIVPLLINTFTVSNIGITGGVLFLITSIPIGILIGVLISLIYSKIKITNN